MYRREILNNIARVDTLAKASRWSRFCFAPFSYLTGMVWSKMIYPLTRTTKVTSVTTIFQETMKVALPTGLDIYLLGAKTHDSELRLAAFFCRYIKQGNTVFDVGAHLGFFSLLASSLAGDKGRIVSFEASATLFPVLEFNSSGKKNILPVYGAVSFQTGSIRFYEFPMLYSEYNSINKEQYKDAVWLASVKAKEVMVPAITLDQYSLDSGLFPDIIKIDVEGGEWDVLRGSQEVLTKHKPIVVMEFIPPSPELWETSVHVKACRHLHDIGYEVFKILKTGHLQKIADEQVDLSGFDSDNLVFLHPENIKEPCSET